MAILNGHEVAFTKPSFNTRDGTKQITANGEYTIDTYEKVNVAVPQPSGDIEITENGEYNVSAYATATVDVAGSGGISGGYVVTFKVDDNDYYIASCEAGGTISEPPTPTKQGYNFSGWKLNNVDIAFPYTPSADIEFIASFTDAIFLVHFDGSLQSIPQATIAAQTNIAYNDNGKFSKCLTFANNMQLKYSANPLNKTTSQARTIEFWGKSTSTSGGGNIFSIKPSSTEIFGLYINAIRVVFQYRGSTIFRIDHNINSGEWFHVALILDTNEFRIYINGELKGTQSGTSSYSESSGFTILQNSDSNMNCAVDELAIFDYAKYTADFTPPTAPY